MHQLHAIEQLVTRFKQDPAVEAIFLKGSFGRGEEDVYSDIDLYCLVSEERMAKFLTRRLTHLSVYRPIIWKDDLFIVAPQLIVVYDDLLHVDLFTVTRESLNHSDTIRVLYDPKRQLDAYVETSSLALGTQEAADEAIYDVLVPATHHEAARLYRELLQAELPHLQQMLIDQPDTLQLLESKQVC